MTEGLRVEGLEGLGFKTDYFGSLRFKVNSSGRSGLKCIVPSLSISSISCQGFRGGRFPGVSRVEGFGSRRVGV
jgi:hypothetical protein